MLEKRTSGRLVRPSVAVDGRAFRGWTATQAGDRSVARMLGLQFIAAAILAGLMIALPDTEGRAFLGAIAVAGLLTGLFLRFSPMAGEGTVDNGITAAILLITGAVMTVHPLGLSPVLYLWPLVLSAYYASPGRLAGNMTLAGVSFVFALATTANTNLPILAFALCAAVATGVVLVVRGLRSKVAALYVELEELASRDELTGALTLEAFQRAVKAWVGGGDRRHGESSLLLLEIDNFDEIVTERGHGAGDEMLSHTAAIVQSVIRETDAVGRLGGQQFGVLLPATSGPLSLGTAERIRAAVARRSEECGIRFTVSLGATGGNSFNDAWIAAQRALSLAIMSGRDRVVSAETETQSHAQYDHEDPRGDAFPQVA